MINHLRLTLRQLLKYVCWLPQTIANTVEHRRQQLLLDELEAERLDRIRNPHKYRGK